MLATIHDACASFYMLEEDTIHSLKVHRLKGGLEEIAPEGEGSTASFIIADSGFFDAVAFLANLHVANLIFD
jgi:hypothetical protein